MKKDWVFVAVFGLIATLVLANHPAEDSSGSDAPESAAEEQQAPADAAEQPAVVPEADTAAVAASDAAEPKPAVVDANAASPGDTCTAGCSDHRAGYEWARQRAIADPDDCIGGPDPFIEGCRAYVREQSGEPEEADEGRQRDD